MDIFHKAMKVQTGLLFKWNRGIEHIGKQSLATPHPTPQIEAFDFFDGSFRALKQTGEKTVTGFNRFIAQRILHQLIIDRL